MRITSNQGVENDKPTKAPISERALLQRINRRLKPDLEALKKRRDRRGYYYRIDYRINAVLEHDVDLAVMGRDLGVLRDWDAVSEQQ